MRDADLTRDFITWYYNHLPRVEHPTDCCSALFWMVNLRGDTCRLRAR